MITDKRFWKAYVVAAFASIGVLDTVVHVIGWLA